MDSENLLLESRLLKSPMYQTPPMSIYSCTKLQYQIRLALGKWFAIPNILSGYKKLLDGIQFYQNVEALVSELRGATSSYGLIPKNWIMIPTLHSTRNQSTETMKPNSDSRLETPIFTSKLIGCQRVLCTRFCNNTTLCVE